MPSVHVWPTFALPMPPQVLNQAPPGAQQLVLPDFKNVPHFGHAIVLAIVKAMDDVLTDTMIGVLAMSSRLGISVVTGIPSIDPDEPANMSNLDAFEWTQAAPQNFRLNDVASENMKSMLSTLDTSHFEMSPLNDVA